MRSRFPPLLILLLAGAVLPAEAQTIQGIVRDTAGAALEGATVLLSDGRDSVRAVTQSGPGGRYTLRSEPGDTVRVRAERLGYRAMRSQLFVLAARSELELEIRLSPAPVELAELSIRSERHSLRRAEFERRRRSEPWGRFADAERIGRVRSPRAADRLRPIIPGMVVGPDGIVRVRKRGADLTGVPTCQPRYYIDGVRYPGDMSLDALVEGDLIRGVEYYDNPDVAPAQFTLGFDPMVFTGINLDGQLQSSFGFKRPCAIIVIWTVHSFGWEQD